MDAFLSKKHNIEPPVIIDTMAESVDNETSATQDVDAELTQKYGQGESYLRKCATCNYEQIIQTAGVHVLTGGVTKVYTDDDEFACPNCECDVSNTDELLESCDKKPGDHTPVAGLDNNKGAENGKTGDHTTTNDGEDILPPKGNKTAATMAKRKRKSNVEKSLDVLFQKFQDASSSDFSRLQKWEETKMQKEQEFRLQQSILENQRRREESEHEIKMLQMMMVYAPGTHIEASPPNIHVTGDLHLPVNANFSSRSLYRSHSSSNINDSSDHSTSYFEL